MRDDRTEAAFSVRKVVMLLSLVYMSAADEPFDQDRLDALLEHARARNGASGLSGLLVYKDGRFMQLLEGPEAAVLETYQRIIEDPRHTDVGLLVEERIHTPRFGEWTMAFDRGHEAALPDGFDTFLTDGDRSADTSKARALLRWFRTHPMAAPDAALGKHRR
ncbi:MULTISPECIES: BLUF domain-containing protein [Curtobacterium]|uniref:BLUF domain-containing protein n=1 Tax=Curtobacterium citreum TaxID=2036 RepID=A0ABU8YDY3_9MICO